MRPNPSLRVAVLSALAMVTLLLGGGAGERPAEGAPASTAPFTWLRSWSEAQQVARTRGCLILVSSTRPGCTLCEAFRNQVVPACLAELTPLAVGYLYHADRPEDPRPDRALRQNLPRARMLPLVGFLTPEGTWLHGFWGPRKAAQFRGDLAHVRTLAAAQRPAPRPQATASQARPATLALPRAAAPPAHPAAPSGDAAAPARAPVAAPAPTPTQPPTPAPIQAPAAAPTAEPEGVDIDELCPNGMCHLDLEEAPEPTRSGTDLVKSLGFDPDAPGRTPAIPVARVPSSRFPAPTPSRERAVVLTGSPDGEQPAARAALVVPPPARTTIPDPDEHPVVRAARAGRFRDAYTWSADWPGVRRLALDRAAEAWAQARLASALTQALEGQYDLAVRSIEDVQRELGGRPQALDAASGRGAVEALRDLRRLREPDTATTRARREAKHAELDGTRWAALFAENVR